MNKNTNKILRISATVIIVLLVVAVVAFIGSRGIGKADFYLVHKGTKIKSDINDLLLEKGVAEQFYVKTFVTLKEEKQEYYITVECIPDADNFYFDIDNQPSSFHATKADVTEFFEIDTKEDCFTVTLDENFKVTDVIEQMYSGKKVTFSDDVDCSKSFFKIVVHSKDGTPVYNIGFRCEYETEKISIDKGTVPNYFGGGFE